MRHDLNLRRGKLPDSADLAEPEDRETCLPGLLSSLPSEHRKHPWPARWLQTKRNEAEFVVCLKNEGYAASLEVHKIYRVTHDLEADRDGDLRIVNECGEDYLYPKDWFVLIEVPEAVEASLLGTIIYETAKTAAGKSKAANLSYS
jgi:hypothetical protein